MIIVLGMRRVGNRLRHYTLKTAATTRGVAQPFISMLKH